MDDRDAASSQAVCPTPPRRRVRGTKAQAAENRARIIAVAARQFRERGFAGIGVAELMGRVGLTHGAFYSHFSSKEELMALACRRAVADMLADWQCRTTGATTDPVEAITGPYLSAAHRDDPGNGCLMAALGPEAARAPAPIRRAVTDCLEEVLGTLAARMPDGDAATRRRAAIRLFASLVGALVVARAVDDPALSDEILEAIREKLKRGV
jgi:TetR/AcrR family transcriptional regulator, transcriptional repressor for nem operon